MTAPKTMLRFADEKPKKMRRSARFIASVEQTRGRKYEVRTAPAVSEAVAPAK
jgi:hypothetical protein